jgi:hypothetical protein
MYELEDINVLQSNRIDELMGVLKGLYVAVVCGLPLEDQLRRVRETVDTEEDKREPQEFKVAAEAAGRTVGKEATMAKIIATYSPCCGIFREGDAEEGVMHSALPHEWKTIKLVDAASEAESLAALEMCLDFCSGQAGSYPHECVIVARAAIDKIKGQSGGMTDGKATIQPETG